MQSFRVFRIIEEFCQHRTENVEQGFGRHYLVMEYNQDALVVVRCGNERETAHPNTADHQFELLNKATKRFEMRTFLSIEDQIRAFACFLDHFFEFFIPRPLGRNAGTKHLQRRTLWSNLGKGASQKVAWQRGETN